MTRAQLILVLGAIALAVILFQLPRSVVENEQLQEVTETKSHSMEIPQEVETQINELRRLLQEEGNFDKKANFAHSLARQYLDYGVLDSAARYAEFIEQGSNSPSELVADIYFTAYERSSGPEQAKAFAVKAREILQRLLDKDPTNLFIKNRLAMTLVVSENPMAGVAMLREILATDETNRQAILNLGLLAIQSGQFERAKERFENLISLNAGDHEAKLYLAVSMMEINQQSQARLLLEEILATQDSIPAIKMMANDYLKGL
ncbi:Tetratricopeptide repeat-containing protein [Ekhidna lutea]|uniref:Tetratricopeptide repeat-containing protein n=1 Tax=Ekhidna lutea TaxID=447679 RepID=A0A239ERU5_EKHLU|nr:tetratricopeptide repeat protein [Ekhidna lutea]SNS47131.1 Tetratricopeptide repeat-containing protein [Ekhidna lutea]